MRKLDRLPTPEEFALNVFRQRDFAAEQLLQFADPGDLGAVRKAERLIKKWDKLIAKYDLERYRCHANHDPLQERR